MEQKSIKAGDRVRIKSLEEIEATLDGSWRCGNVLMNKATMAQFAGKESTVREPHTAGVILDNGWHWHRDWLEPIDEPTADAAATIDLSVLLQGCEGAVLYSLVDGPVTLTGIGEEGDLQPIEVADSDGDASYYTREGCYLAASRRLGGEPVLYPSREQRDWNKWEKPKPEAWKPEPGEDYWFLCGTMTANIDSNIEVDIDVKRIAAGNCFRTREEAEEAAEELRKCLKAFRERKR